MPGEEDRGVVGRGIAMLAAGVSRDSFGFSLLGTTEGACPADSVKSGWGGRGGGPGDGAGGKGASSPKSAKPGCSSICTGGGGGMSTAGETSSMSESSSALACGSPNPPNIILSSFGS